MSADAGSPRMKRAAPRASAAWTATGSAGPAAGITDDSGRMTQGGAQSGASTKFP